MNIPRCEVCGLVMTRYGYTSRGTQRWRCRACGVSRVGRIDNTAKLLERFLKWLTSGELQKNMPGAGRTFRRKNERLWQLWPFCPVVDEVHPVVFVDGLHLGRQAVVLIACTNEHVLGWYVARSENSRAWGALMSRIAPPDVVVTDGSGGFEKARRQHWPDTSVQRCVFHVFMNLTTATTRHPRLPASQELRQLALALLKAKTPQSARQWIRDYMDWLRRWEAFLAQRTATPNGTLEYTHARLVKARNSTNKILADKRLFTFLDDEWDITMPSTNNRIEGAINAPLRQMLRDHRGMSLTRRIKAIFWWCYMHSPNPLPPAQLLKTFPTDSDIENTYHHARQHHQTATSIPQWGDAIVWAEIHHTTPYTNRWD
ncbi:IS1249 family transposase [Schaalia sp. ZJ405]|uniref:IS1249 family transposase n=1 Tax=Schaalia sp. ZJ405 TaxID=2709403 RepID=UPI0018C9F286|nr:IS1249 family transposase [Schaalia sp. ZJ405]QPK80584.1 IS1249 family transposase [Schaalia sp. ZJ405]QPK81477.1 IS1249 family transposase [Schaalia sp. ZJ405]QPK81782.1 IS1249 family transposase [Schaalia sp. ZJ405]